MRRVDDDVAFDAGKPPPFRIGDVRAAVPEQCWRKSPWRSLWYVAVVLALGAAQGTMFWARFVLGLGHD
ncbi:putative fatty acid desaturase DES1 [Zea mays]|jgi:hypothetical protein|uniref:Acyl-lipid omega-3 desaturase (Cytochrome b5) endoplasmic reticulum n=2 Tax=Zea mays TaxID=4577 RepID=A0A1D6EJS1_MAIZE|nr:Acyl-lipid omega-3 desaturase (cytochrome b5) endoplasmic reticulum [Zea mays]PWZ37426.1 putative fatty acid desaturase DES1 [Zea mays]